MSEKYQGGLQPQFKLQISKLKNQIALAQLFL